MSSSLGKLPDLSAKEEPEESLPPEPVSGGTFTSENVTNTQASPESSNTAPKNEESKQDSPAGTQEISDEEAEVLDFLLTIRRNTGSMLEALSETAMSSEKKEPSVPSEKDPYSDKENPNSGISTRESEKLFVCENAANILWALRERKGADLDIMMEEGGRWGG